jgi:hypothetical protein
MTHQCTTGNGAIAPNSLRFTRAALIDQESAQDEHARKVIERQHSLRIQRFKYADVGAKRSLWIIGHAPPLSCGRTGGAQPPYGARDRRFFDAISCSAPYASTTAPYASTTASCRPLAYRSAGAGPYLINITAACLRCSAGRVTERLCSESIRAEDAPRERPLAPMHCCVLCPARRTRM